MTELAATQGGLILSALFSFIVLGCAHKFGYFKLPPKTPPFQLPFKYVLGAFVFFLFAALVVFSIAYFLVLPWLTGISVKEVATIPYQWKGWIHIISITLVLIALLGYCALIKKDAAHAIFWGDQKPSWDLVVKNIGWGIASLLIAYPLVIFVHVFSSHLSEWIFGKSGIEQVAVKELGKAKGDPGLLAAMSILTAIIVPFLEELLFRGFLQTWIRRYVGRIGTIFVTGLIFACAHFAASQGVGNFELIISLFSLSCFLGFIYERQKTLWAPFGLHMSFNGLNVIGLLWSA